MQCILVCFLKSLFFLIWKDKKTFLHHYNGDASIFRLAYSIKSYRVCGWNYEWVSNTY